MAQEDKMHERGERVSTAYGDAEVVNTRLDGRVAVRMFDGRRRWVDEDAILGPASEPPPVPEPPAYDPGPEDLREATYPPGPEQWQQQLMHEIQGIRDDLRALHDMVDRLRPAAREETESYDDLHMKLADPAQLARLNSAWKQLKTHGRVWVKDGEALDMEDVYRSAEPEDDDGPA